MRWKSWKLIARTVSLTSSLFVAQRPSTYTLRGTWGNFRETKGGVGKSGVLEQKSGNISETCKDEKLLWMAYRNSPTLFRTVPLPTPTASPSSRLGVRNPNPKLQSLLSQEGQIWPIHSQGPSEQKPMKIWEKKERERLSVSRDCPNFLSSPYYLRNAQSYELQILYAHSQDRSEQKPIKHFGKSSRGRTQGLSRIFRAPLYKALRAVIFVIAHLSCCVKVIQRKLWLLFPDTV